MQPSDKCSLETPQRTCCIATPGLDIPVDGHGQRWLVSAAVIAARNVDAAESIAKATTLPFPPPLKIELNDS